MKKIKLCLFVVIKISFNTVISQKKNLPLVVSMLQILSNLVTVWFDAWAFQYKCISCVGEKGFGWVILYSAHVWFITDTA